MSRNRYSIKSDRLQFEGALNTKHLGRKSRWFDRITSTNDAAKSWANEGAEHGAMIFADYQSQGRGRQGRTWEASQGLNLTVSLVLRPNLPASGLGLVTIGASLAVSASIEACCSGVRSTIKWPNDILIEEKKCCGMLLESAVGKDPSESYVVLGIGLNVNQDTFPDEIRDKATSVMLGYGRSVDRILLLADVLSRLEKEFAEMEKGHDILIKDYEERLAGLGHSLVLTDVHTGTTYSGIMAGVDPTGALLLEVDSEVRVFHAGDIHMTTVPG